MPDVRVASVWSAVGLFYADQRLSELKIIHGMTTRRLGDMKNTALRSQAAALLKAPEPLTLRQTHSNHIVVAEKSSSSGVEADGWLLGPNASGICVAVYIADCLPVYVWSDDGRVAGLFHAGWRGLAAGILSKAIDEFQNRFHIVPTRLRASVGPHISSDRYRVGPEVAAQFAQSSLIHRGEDIYLDLGAEALRQLVAAGVDQTHIAICAECTATREDLFYSYRRDKQGVSMMAFLCLPSR